MSKLTIDPRLALRMNVRDSHKALWLLFGDRPDRTRDFLYRTLDGRTFLSVSARSPEDHRGLWQIQTKPYEPALSAGDRLYFDLRVNPVRSVRGQDRKQRRYDVVQDARVRLRQQGTPEEDIPSRALLAEQEGAKWLLARQEKLGLEADPETITAMAYTVHEFAKPKGRTMRFSSLDLKGLCTVTDPERLRSTLFGGIGPAKAYGCGLMLVRRA